MTDREMIEMIFSRSNYCLYVNEKRYIEVATDGCEHLGIEFDDEGNLTKIF